jgi:hypothetical protein
MMTWRSGSILMAGEKEKRVPLRKTLVEKLRACLRDDSAQALTEYVLLMLVVCTFAFWLYHPDNGFYKAARDRYELTTLLLTLPGP